MKYHLLFITLLGLVFTVVLNADLLYMVQERSLFMSGSIFLADCMRVPGGFLTWLGLWFTQFFYYPYVGGSMLVLLWLALYVVLQRAFRPTTSWLWILLIPVVALMVSTIDLGYWIYLLKQHGYWFRETLGFLFVALLLWLQGRENQLARTVVASILALASYPLLGWYSVLALVCIIIRQAKSLLTPHSNEPSTKASSSRQEHKNALSAAARTSLLTPHSSFLIFIAVVSIFAIPLMAGQYSAFRQEEAFIAGFPFIESNLDNSFVLTLPFYLATLILLLLSAFPLQKPLAFAQRRPWLIHALVMVALVLIVFERNCGDRNYHAEMRIYRQVEEFRWKDVMQEMKDATEQGGSTRQMMICKNLALVNLHQADKIFDMCSGDVNRVMRDSCGAYMLYTSGPLLALHHGMANTAIRWTIESSVEYGFSVTALKILTLAALINKESDVADKYLSMLNLNLFQSSWVARYRPLVKDPKLITEYPELAAIRTLHQYPDNQVYGDHGHVEAEIYKPFSNLINPTMPDIQPLGGYYALLEKNQVRFWKQLQYYIQLHPGQKVPVVFQEAAYLFHKKDPEGTAHMNLKFSDEIKARYDAFNKYANTHANPNMSQEEIGAILKPKFGRTYWWYYYFNHTTLY